MESNNMPYTQELAEVAPIEDRTMDDVYRGFVALATRHGFICKFDDEEQHYSPYLFKYHDEWEDRRIVVVNPFEGNLGYFSRQVRLETLRKPPYDQQGKSITTEWRTLFTGRLDLTNLDFIDQLIKSVFSNY